MKKRALSILTALILSISLVGTVSMPTTADSSESKAKSRVSVHDPSVFKDKSGTYYVFGTHIEAAKSTDLQNWELFTNGYATEDNQIFGDLSDNLSDAFAWAGEDLEVCEGGYAVWAPDVIYDEEYINSDGTTGAYLMYFCTSSTSVRSVIAYAVSQSPEGPYTFVDTLIYSGFSPIDSYATSETKNVNRNYTSTNIDELIEDGEVTYNDSWFTNSDYNYYYNDNVFPNAIDPCIYYTPEGKMYMCYGSWSGGIFTIEMDPKTGKCIHPETATTSDGRLIDSYFGTKLSGGYCKSGEGPFIEYNSETGYYYLWETYGGLTTTGGYNMRVFRSENPEGPFIDPAGNDAVITQSIGNSQRNKLGLKVMGNYQFSSLDTAYVSCGHNSVLKDDDGQWYILYHTRFNSGSEYYEVRVHSMYFNEEGWPVVAPYEYSGDVISESCYSKSDIVGAYEYINHGTSTSKKIISYSSITLNADGTISGDESGTWVQAQDSPAATLTIGDQTYYGYFLLAKDENGKTVMSFTAVGSDNQTVWGVQSSVEEPASVQTTKNITTAKSTASKARTKTTRSAKQVAKDKKAAKKAMKQAKITKLTVKSKAEKKITVSWKKVKKAKGYQVQVSKKKSFKKNIVNKLTSKKKLTIKNSKIKSKKTYYVRVRAYATYKDVNNKAIKVYSAWNKKLRKIKVK